MNARNHLVRAQKIADAEISNTIAYFCATHATEEAVAAGVSLPFILLADLVEQFRNDYDGVSVEIVESTSAAS